MRLVSFGKRLVVGSLGAGLALALTACGQVATEAPAATMISATAAPTLAPTAPPPAPTAAAIEATALPAIEVPASPTAAGAESAGGAWADVDPCTLLDATTVGVLYGPLEGAPAAADTATSAGRACTFEAAKVTIRVEVYNGNQTPAAQLVAALEQDGMAMESEAGMGDTAYAGRTDDRAALLLVQGDTVVLLDLSNKTDEIMRAATLLRGMAATALANLPDSSIEAEAPADGGVSSAEAPAGEGPCALLTVAEVEQALGALDGEPDGSGQDGSGAPSCAYLARDGLLFMSSLVGDDAALQAQVTRARESGAPLEAVPGLGDEAYVAAAPMEGAPQSDAVQGVLIVRRGDTLLQLGIMSTLDAAATADALKQLAELALARLP